MDKEFTNIISRAFELYKNDHKISSDYKMCAELTISRSTFANWKKGRSQTINSETWGILQPILQPYIDIAEEEQELLSCFDPFEYSFTILDATSEEDKANLRKFMDELNLNMVQLYRSIKGKEQKAPEKTIKFEVPESALPFIQQKVAAGTGIEILEEKYQQRPDMHLLEVSGESMEPTYREGQKLIAQLFQERVVFGDDHIPVDIVKNIIPEDSVIIYDLNGAGLAMKRVKYQKNKKSWYFILEADNEDWAEVNEFPRYVRKADELTIFGKVIGVSE